MTIDQLKARCKKEFRERNRVKWVLSILFLLASLIYLGCIIVNTVNTFSQPGFRYNGLNPLPLLIAGVPYLISRFFAMTCSDAIDRYEKSGEYKDIPVDHPYSLLYPGEPYPFGRTDVPALNTTAAPAPVATPDPAPAAPTPAPTPAQPEQVTITCGQCGQPMLIPVSDGAVKITCPKCGNSFIHTN